MLSPEALERGSCATRQPRPEVATSLKRWARWLVWIAVGGDGIFIAWLVYNAIDDGFRGTGPQIASGVGLVALLALNVYLLLRGRHG